MIEYGKAPKDLGIIDVLAREMMYYLYLPVKMLGSMDFRYEERLWPFRKLLSECIKDYNRTRNDLIANYVYLTVKTMYVAPGCPGNREGWHADGYGSNGDFNYIWANMNPTEFAIQEFKDISQDDRRSMEQFEEQFNGHVITYPNKTLLRLDESVIHRVAPEPEFGIRTFVKVTVSRHQLRNQGNSHNFMFDYLWDEIPRQMERNLDAPTTTPTEAVKEKG